MQKELTKAEEQVMQAIWKVGQGFANEIVAAVDGNVAYNTVLTVVRILEQKGFVGHRTLGGNNQYYPLVSKADYSGRMLGTLMDNYFGGSYRQLVSFFMEDKGIGRDDLDALARIIEEKRKEVQQ